MNTRKRPRNAEPDLLELLGRPEPFQVNAEPVVTHFSVTVDEEFESVRQFENIVRCLEGANQGDTMEIKLSTNGGALHAILPLLSAMQNTEASVFVHAVSDVYSAGTLVLLRADDVCINPHVTIMFHQEQFGSGGPGSSVESHVAHTRKVSKVLMEDLYGDFLSNTEITDMRNGKDFYMDKDEFEKRYSKRHQIRQDRLKEKLAAPVLPVKKPRKKKAVVEKQKTE